MDVVIRLAIMLAAGLVARHAFVTVGRKLAAGNQVRIPSLCSYAVAGTVAALARMGLESLGLAGVVLWIAFGVIWGVIAGLMLPFARKLDRGAATPSS